MYHKALNTSTRYFDTSGDGGQVHANATLIFVKDITSTGVIFDVIVTTKKYNMYIECPFVKDFSGTFLIQSFACFLNIIFCVYALYKQGGDVSSQCKIMRK